jgi:hypothetical protein
MATLSLLYGGKILESREKPPKILLKLILVAVKCFPRRFISG